MNTQFIKARQERVKQMRIMKDTKKSFKFRLNTIMLTGNMPAKKWG